MRLFDVLRLKAPELTPELTKIHLACTSFDRKQKPLTAYMEGWFDEFQSWQSKKSYFNRDYVVSLIQMDETDQWLFAGAYEKKSCRALRHGYRFRLRPIPSCEGLGGRLVARFEKIGRASYRVGEHYCDEIMVDHIRQERMHIPDFPGFKGLHVPKQLLDAVVRENHAGWRSALSSTGGVYLIADSKSGRIYVGSATGKGGFWQRWCQYSATGHGGNREMRALLGVNSLKRAETLSFSVLEIADIRTSNEEILNRERHWKRVLQTRIHGLNAN